jgi:hypothetical protein
VESNRRDKGDRYIKGKFSQKLIDGLKAQPKPFEMRDTELKGFLLRVQPSGVKTYICQYARGRRLTIGSPEIMTPFQARELVKEKLALYLTTGVDPMQQKKVEKAHKFESFVTIDSADNGSIGTADPFLAPFKLFVVEYVFG